MRVRTYWTENTKKMGEPREALLRRQLRIFSAVRGHRDGRASGGARNEATPLMLLPENMLSRD